MHEERDLGRRDHGLTPAPRWQAPMNTLPASWHASMASPEPEFEVAEKISAGKLLRRYWLVLCVFALAGLSAGFMSVLYSSPIYSARLVLMIESDADPLKSANSRSEFSEETNIQTWLYVLRGQTFLQRGTQRLQAESVPLAPARSDLFSKLRQRFRPATNDPLESFKQGINSAVGSFSARPIAGTRLIELTCDSTVPEIASQFLNVMAAEFMEETSRTRMQTSQKTSEWLAAQIEDTKTKVQEAEQRLQEYMRSSGNLFAGETATLDDSKLSQLKTELAKIQAERISKQTKAELVQKTPDEMLPEVMGDAKLSSIREQLTGLRRQKASLETTLTPNHYKVKKIDAEIAVLQNTWTGEIKAARAQAQGEYESAVRQERTLNAAYSGQSQRVGSQAGKAAQFNALKREAETLRQMYQTLLSQANQTGLSSSAPIAPVRLVEAAVTPGAPYKPKPVLNLGFGAACGLLLTVGIAFFRERLDTSVKTPGFARQMLKTPELGVIPNVSVERQRKGLFGKAGRALPEPRTLELTPVHESLKAPDWWSQQPIVAEYFRSTLASLLRNSPSGSPPHVVLITSPAPGDGKTTVAGNVAVAFGETGRRVLLVDADFRKPRLHHTFEVSMDRTLYDLVSGEHRAEYTAAELGSPTNAHNVFVLPNKPTPRGLPKALYSPALRRILDSARKHYDMVIIDAPPMLQLADARVIAPLADGVIMVVRASVTSRADLMQAYQYIREDGVMLLGAILNDWEMSEAHKHHYYAYVDEDRN